MNIVYYIVSSFIKEKNLAVSGAHGYSYDPTKESSRKLIKGAPTVYGYFVNGSYQNIGIDPVTIFNARVIKQINEVEAFLVNLELIINEWVKDKADTDKMLVITNSVKGFKMLKANRCPESINGDLFKRVHSLYKECGDSIILDVEYYAKGGEGPKTAHKQVELAEALCELPSSPLSSLDSLSVKEYKNPEIDFNKLVTATRWYFNTGDKSEFYDLDDSGFRKYLFGQVEPSKKYYGKATPDVFYSILYTKTPISVLDKLYNFCKENRPNPYNIMSGGNLNHIKSKEIARTIDMIPGVFKNKNLMAPVTLGINDDPVLVDFIDPPGLSYRIRDFHHQLDLIHQFFLKRDSDGFYQQHQFVEITDLFFVKDEKGKYKINPDFTNNTSKVVVPIKVSGCVKPVKINLSIKYDTPERNAFNSLVATKQSDIHVYLALDFTNQAGVKYCTITTTPDFEYIHSNSISNLRVYSLKELGQ